MFAGAVDDMYLLSSAFLVISAAVPVSLPKIPPQPTSRLSDKSDKLLHSQPQWLIYLSRTPNKRGEMSWSSSHSINANEGKDGKANNLQSRATSKPGVFFNTPHGSKKILLPGGGSTNVHLRGRVARGGYIPLFPGPLGGGRDWLGMDVLHRFVFRIRPTGVHDRRNDFKIVNNSGPKYYGRHDNLPVANNSDPKDYGDSLAGAENSNPKDHGRDDNLSIVKTVRPESRPKPRKFNNGLPYVSVTENAVPMQVIPEYRPNVFNGNRRRPTPFSMIKDTGNRKHSPSRVQNAEEIGEAHRRIDFEERIATMPISNQAAARGDEDRRRKEWNRIQLSAAAQSAINGTKHSQSTMTQTQSPEKLPLVARITQKFKSMVGLSDSEACQQQPQESCPPT